MDDPAELGFIAGVQGDKRSACPFEPGTEARELWMASHFKGEQAVEERAKKLFEAENTNPNLVWDLPN